MTAPTDSSRVLILGAGIAGSLTARALAERGMASTVIEARPHQTDEPPAGQQIRGALYVRLGVDYSPETRFAHQALVHAIEHYERFQAENPDVWFFHQSGLLQLAWNDRERVRQAKFLERNQYPADTVRGISAAEAGACTGLDLDDGGLWFPRCGHLFPLRLCRAALAHPNIEVKAGTRIASLEQTPGESSWRATTADGDVLQHDRLVIAAGAASRPWLPESIPLKAIRGQISFMPALPEQAPKSVVCGGGYALPPLDSTQIVGATFDRGDADPQPREDSHRQNLERLRDWLPALACQWTGQTEHEAAVGFRATLPDHLPVAGALDSVGSMYALTGLGSKGLAYAPLLAEHVASLVAGEQPLLDDELAMRVSPTRYL